MDVFTNQVKALAWKNAVLKFRFKFTLLFELVIPVGIMLALAGIRSVLKPQTSDIYFPSTPSPGTYNSMLLQQNKDGDKGACVNNVFWRCPLYPDSDKTYVYGSCTQNGADPMTATGNSLCQRLTIAVAPDDSSDASAVAAAQDYMDFMNNYLYSDAVQARYSDWYNTSIDYTWVDYFDSADAFDAHISSKKYSLDPTVKIYNSAIIFTSGYPSYKYVVRVNQTVTPYGYENSSPSTSGDYNVDISVKTGDDYVGENGQYLPYMDNYFSSYYISLMDSVTTFVTTKACQGASKCDTDSAYIFHTQGGVQFPHGTVLTFGFWSALGDLFALLVIISLLFPFSNMLKALVHEKESKLREGMLMMAMKGTALWTSWLFHFYSLFLVLAILLTLASSLLFKHSDTALIFVYFIVFFMASISFSILMSVFFTRARTATIVGTLLHFGGYFVYIGVQATLGSNASRSQLMAAMIHPAAAFTYGTLAFTEYEDADIGVTFYTWQTSTTFPITFQDCLNMMFIDSIWMALLAWYLNHVWPSEYGTHEPWYFIFMPSYWIGCFKSFAGCFLCRSSSGSYGRVISPKLDGDLELVNLDSNVEPVSDVLQAQVEAKTCVDIHNLVKEFQFNGVVKNAVDGLNLTMYSGQITALLGHNGAGKTTTISMLTGLIPPTSGSAIIEGYDIAYDMDEIRKNLGVCPQHDILYPDLTVQEHLIMFASFKGLTGNKIKDEVEKMIQSVGLTEKRHALSKTLSGGQKRKLSVGIAFIGGSKVVFLDEPTSGMDPYSRRFTWNIIRQHKEGRIIVLTTHFMDEADNLGDRIAIMGDGKLRCCGSSLYLKKTYGVGYNMTIEKHNPLAFNSQMVLGDLHKFVADAKIITDAGAELTVQLPLSAASKFQEMFSSIDNKMESMGIESYGMSVTTLEEVFIKVAHGTQTQQVQNTGKTKQERIEEGADTIMADFVMNKLDTSHHLQYFIKHIHAMFVKRVLYFSRDTKSWILSFFLPFVFVLLGMIVITTSSLIVIQPQREISTSMYNEGCTEYYPMRYNTEGFDLSDVPYGYQGGIQNNNYTFAGLNLDTLPTDIMGNIVDNVHFPLDGNASFYDFYDISQSLWLHRDDLKAAQFGSAAFSDYYTNVTSSQSMNKTVELDWYLYANFTGRYAAPLTHALVSEGLARTYDPTITLGVSIYPFPLTYLEKELVSSYNIDTVTTFIMLAMPFVAASFAAFIVREKEIKSRHLQFVSGISVWAYWSSAFMWDFLCYLVTAWSMIFLYGVFPETDLFIGASAFGPFVGLFILFGPAMIGFTYCCSFFFKTPSGAQIAMVSLFIVTGLILTIVGLVLRILFNDKYMSVIRFIFMLIPPYAFGDGLHSLALIQLWSLTENEGGELYKASDMNITGYNLVFLAWEGVVFFGIAVLYEYISSIPSLASLIDSWIMYLSGNKIPVVNIVRDEDVIAEETRVKSEEVRQNSSILVDGLKKIYPGGKYAVKGVSLAIPNGECFGLLGINGAGKSSTLSILSGEFPPTEGQAWLGGLNLLTDIHQCRRKIGYCPQFDALFELLTAREHLYLYARIKGIMEKDLPQVVENKLNEMGLVEYADKPAGTYSGGNKRKLSVAIAMIGEPSIVFLDEPSTGMDPVARRFMWDVITDIVTKREKCSVILTTHSMEECEALCTRIGIMVGGVLRCLGSAQRLRARYGHGFQIEIGLALPTSAENEAKEKELFNLLGKKTVLASEITITKDEVWRLLDACNKSFWKERLSHTGSGSEIIGTIENLGSVSLKVFTAWYILESYFDSLCQFLHENFTQFYIRERQSSKVRVEIESLDSNGSKRSLSYMFGIIEKGKDKSHIQEYSISQTSLEQIFNQFASQQTEETGSAVGIVQAVPAQVPVAVSVPANQQPQNTRVVVNHNHASL